MDVTALQAVIPVAFLLTFSAMLVWLHEQQD